MALAAWADILQTKHTTEAPPPFLVGANHLTPVGHIIPPHVIPPLYPHQITNKSVANPTTYQSNTLLWCVNMYIYIYISLSLSLHDCYIMIVNTHLYTYIYIYINVYPHILPYIPHDTIWYPIVSPHGSCSLATTWAKCRRTLRRSGRGFLWTRGAGAVRRLLGGS